MSEHRILATAGILLAAAMAQQAVAQTDMTTTASCDSIEFTSQVLNQVPNAKDYCLEVALKDGDLYAHFATEFVRRSGSDVVLRFKKPDGTFSDPIQITPPDDQRVNIDGRNYRVRDLNRGDEIDIWLPHDRFEVAFAETEEEFTAAPAVSTYAATVVDEEPEPAVLRPCRLLPAWCRSSACWVRFLPRSAASSAGSVSARTDAIADSNDFLRAWNPSRPADFLPQRADGRTEHAGAIRPGTPGP